MRCRERRVAACPDRTVQAGRLPHHAHLRPVLGGEIRSPARRNSARWERRSSARPPGRLTAAPLRSARRRISAKNGATATDNEHQPTRRTEPPSPDTKVAPTTRTSPTIWTNGPAAAVRRPTPRSSVCTSPARQGGSDRLRPQAPGQHGPTGADSPARPSQCRRSVHLLRRRRQRVYRLPEPRPGTG